MQALPSSGAVASFSAEREKLPPNAQCTRLRVVSRVAMVLPGGHAATGGECIVDVLERDQYSSDLVADVMAQAWDADEPRRIEQAREDFELAIDEETMKTGPVRDIGKVEATRHRVVELCGRPDVDASSERLEALTAEEKLIHARRMEVYLDTGQSVEASFYRRFRRGINPLISVEVLEQHIPVKEQMEAKRADSTMTEGLLRDLLSVLRPAEASDQSAEIASLKEQIARLEEMVTSPKKK